MSYRIELTRSAEKELDRLPANIRDRIARRLLALEDQPRPRGAKRLVGGEGYRLRVGDYRVLYVVDDEAQTIMVYAVGHRREAYR